MNLPNMYIENDKLVIECPTTGYSGAFKHDPQTGRDVLVWREPEPDKMYAQVITPVEVPLPGQLGSIREFDRGDSLNRRIGVIEGTDIPLIPENMDRFLRFGVQPSFDVHNYYGDNQKHSRSYNFKN